jgi:hypothetical protein
MLSISGVPAPDWYKPSGKAFVEVKGSRCPFERAISSRAARIVISLPLPDEVLTVCMDSLVED